MHKTLESVAVDDLFIDMAEYEEQGFTIVRGLFSPEEVDLFREHFMQLAAEGRGFFEREQKAAAETDPLKKFPRMVHMHRWDGLSLEFLLDQRSKHCLTTLLGAEPYAVQTMFYFKPPGARGQALHQDQAPLKVQPGTCIAAWMSLDDCDEANGCLQLVPGTQDLPLLCSVAADTAQSFTNSTVPLSEEMQPIPAIMEPGDVLFFNGQVIHGSSPNTTEDRFRRSLIGHYIVAEAEKVSAFYHPVLRFDGSEAEMGVNPGGEPCGIWVNRDGRAVLEMTN
ncbi:MAG TPA: phytanoyl-CoA dioxygenase family protein [Caldilineaceae bacterium]|nr:phytanoyl-CoA dioxygenase family protein [Caldilineaceae bacterium]